ncbi:beta-1,6-N-acetylglucosaminyltransferase, partial [Neobacillus niacini]|uniref:beta-1,6-N-acetylglucosaminyltransferase n=1 Tax=Neobacillus niacini TaxID=86668 RepID=UPI002FFE1D3E
MNTTPRTAYILQIHKNPDQVNKFINQLIFENHADIFIHIDKRNYEKIKGKIVKSPNVKIIQKSFICEWGDISQVDTTIRLLKEVLASKNNYDFVCLRSGQDLLVKDDFKGFLLNNKEKIFMDFRKMNEENLGFMMIKWPKITRRRYNATHPIRIYRKILLSLYSKGINFSPNINSWPNEYSFYKGSQWFSIPFEVAKYIIDFLEKNEWY